MAMSAINLWNKDLLENYQNDILQWLGRSILPMPSRGLPSTFEFKKAQVSGTTASTNVNEILGIKVAEIIIDEIGSQVGTDMFRRELVATVLPPVAAYRDPRHPSADVVVEEEILDKHHPLNPNPAAGPITQWVIVAGGKRSKPLRSLAIAKATAKALHERLLAALVDEAKERMPNYGVFG